MASWRRLHSSQDNGGPFLPTLHTVRANTERFEELRKDRFYSDLAGELGVHQSTLTRIIREGVAPGPRFIAQALLTFPHTFDELFSIVVDEKAANRA